MADQSQRKPAVLLGLRISEVSLVDAGANQKAYVVLFKSLEYGADDSEFDSLESAVVDAEKALRADASLDAQEDMAEAAVYDRFGEQDPKTGMWIKRPRIENVFKDNIVFCLDGAMYRIQYTMGDNGFQLQGDKIPVALTYVDKSDAESLVELISGSLGVEPVEESSDDAALKRLEESIELLQAEAKSFDLRLSLNELANKRF